MEALREYQSIYKENKDFDYTEYIYQKAIELYNQHNYSMCDLYLTELGEYKDSKKYIQLTSLLENSTEKKENHLRYTNILIGLKNSGFQPAIELLSQEPFSDYVNLLEKQGMYRSDNSYMKPQHDDDFINEMIGGDAERYVYIHISDEIISGSYAPKDQLMNPISEKIIKNHAESSNYNCICIYEGDGKYHCEVKYTNPSYSSESYTETYDFEMYFDNDKLIVTSLHSSETGKRVSFVEGTYSKIS